jgi:glycosyltransferase involved in cell wall biosynthesis
MKLSIVIPAYNEGKRILPTLEGYYSFFKEKFGNDFEIIVVINNSTDDTLEVTKEFSKNRKQIKIMNIPHYTGKGGAVMKGFEIAKGDLIGFTDADNATDAKNFFKLYKNIGKSEGIIASRKICGAVINPRRRIGQDISSFLFNLIPLGLFGLRYKDTQCGAKLFTKETAKMLVEEGTEKSWAFDVGLLHLCKKYSLDVLEFPIYWRDSPGSKLTFRDGVISALGLIKYRFKVTS